MEWIVIVGLVVAMYIVIYKYEKKMDNIHKIVQENKEKLELHGDKISKNREHIDENYDNLTKTHTKLKEYDNHIEQMWVTLPKDKKDS
jgi:peptidoglycan hydrolase CwlO-like protein